VSKGKTQAANKINFIEKMACLVKMLTAIKWLKKMHLVRRNEL